MKTLYIDTHMDINIALLDDFNIIREEKILDKNQNSVFLIETIKKVVGNDSYQQIIVVNGPGSFTGVRLGVTIAKTLAFTLSVPIKTITYLELMAINIFSNNNKIVAFNDKNGYYIGEFDNDNVLQKDYSYISNDQYLKLQDQSNIFTSFDNDYKKLIEYMNNKESLNPHSVNPIYVKKIEVEK